MLTNKSFDPDTLDKFKEYPFGKLWKNLRTMQPMYFPKIDPIFGFPKLKESIRTYCAEHKIELPEKKRKADAKQQKSKKKPKQTASE